jgi:hypothetical protein
LADVPFEDIRIDQDESNSKDEDKESLKFQVLHISYLQIFHESELFLELSAASLPMLQVGDLVLCKSELSGTEVALCRYLARRFNLIGKDEFEAVACDQVGKRKRSPFVGV